MGLDIYPIQDLLYCVAVVVVFSLGFISGNQR